MKLKKIFILLITFSFIANNAKAQDTFYGEVGLSGGCGFVLGDTNDFLFKYPQPAGGLYLKYKINGRWETRLQLDGGLLGYAQGQNMSYTSLQALAEFNFFNYGVKRWEAHYSWFTPYVTAGVGAIVFNFVDKPRFSATIPLGLGVKFKLANRVNVGAFWMVSKVFSDKFDKTPNLNGEYGKFWNNQDWYSTAQIFLSFNFYKICAPCRNGRKQEQKK